MRGIFLLPSLGSGGAERVSIRLIRQFIRLGVDCQLIVITNSDNRLRNILLDSVRVKYLACSRVLFGWFRIIRITRSESPDFIFSTHPHISFLILASKFLLPKRTALIVRESSIVSKNIPGHGFSRLSWLFLYWLLYRFADSVICQSKDMADDAVVNRLIPRRLISIINNPIDFAEIALKASAAEQPMRIRGKRYLVSAGRFTPDKGFDLLIAALAMLRCPDIHLWLIGEGRDLEAIISLAAELEVSNQITFLGYLENPYPYYVNADFYVMSSRFEGFPNAVLESLALGTPVIAMPCPGGIHDMLLPGLNGYFSSEIAPEAMGSAIWRALDAEPLQRRLVIDSVLDKFSADRISMQYFELIRQATCIRREG